VSGTRAGRPDEAPRPTTGNPDEAGLAVKTIILAGGKGTRLKPYTSVLPKPLMPLGDRAILEILIRQLARQGFADITLSVGHLAHLIEAVFGDGVGHDADLTYVREDVPLGTAGSLRLVPDLDSTFLMLNGDLVTTFDYREIVSAHRASGNMLTIAVLSRRVEVDYGVLTVDHVDGEAPRVVQFTEKPKLDFNVSMGIYVLEPEVLRYIPEQRYFDFPDLVQRLLAEDIRIGAFEYGGLWLDIGRQEDYERAVSLLEEGSLGLLDDEFDPPPRAGAPRRGQPLDSSAPASARPSRERGQ
jgi:NDP-sugar pyrophosphorylase family protein